MLERLQKVISQAGVASRREAELIIKAGRVTVNGAVVTELGTKVSPGRDQVAVDGKRLKSENNVYLMLNKPKGVITTVKDPGKRQTVLDYLKDIPQRIYPVGRLDFNTEGLLLLTNDGELTNALIHPSRKIFKTYLAKVKGIPSEEKLDLLRAGIKLEDGVTAPAQIYLTDIDQEKQSATLEITIHEGKNRQIRRMCEAIGFPIRQLKRTKFAGLALTGLRRGQYRHLSDNEVEMLKNLTVRK